MYKIFQADVAEGRSCLLGAGGERSEVVITHSSVSRRLECVDVKIHKTCVRSAPRPTTPAVGGRGETSIRGAQGSRHIVAVTHPSPHPESQAPPPPH